MRLCESAEKPSLVCLYTFTSYSRSPAAAAVLIHASCHVNHFDLPVLFCFLELLQENSTVGRSVRVFFIFIFF